MSEQKAPLSSQEASARDPDGLPTRFGKYTLIRKLASGGMAELFLAIQKSVAGFEKLLVIKRILPAMNQDRAFVDMLLHEARIAATLSHPNIVQIFDVGREDGQFFIAMEHVHGEDLRSMVRQMKVKGALEFPIEHALAIVLGMCAGLAYAHEKRDLDGTPLGIVHRDISPQNVVVTFTGDVKIVDFGIAKSQNRTGEATKSGKLKGKVPYMSPEQARGEQVDARSDIFSTGVMLFELTTGRRLFKGASEYETLKLICEREYPLPSEIIPDYPADLEAIVMRALSKDRELRYQSAREMQGDIEAFVRAHQIAVSNIALHRFMQDLFEEKLAAQKEALVQGKQLADIIEMQHARAEAENAETSGQRLLATGSQSMPAAARTVTELPAYKRRKRVLTTAAAIAAGAVLGGSAWYAFRATTRPAPVTTNVTPAKASVTISSNPAGASIWINGDLRPETTPATIAALPIGVPLEIKLTKDGYDLAKKELVLRTAADEPVTLELRAVPVVEAKVTADAGSPVSPVSSPRTGHRAAAASTAHAAAQPGGSGKLNVGASGGWCNVTVDGAARGATPVAGIELPAGSHKVTCTTADGHAQSAVVTVPSDGSTTRYKFAL